MKQFKLNKIDAVSMMIFCLTLVLGTVNYTYAAVIGFEEIYPVLNKSNTNSMPTNYTGFNWSGTFCLMTKEYAATGTSGVGYRKGMIGNVVAYTAGAAGANQVEMSSVNPFDFTGAYITSVWKTNQDVQVQGYYNGQLMYTTTIITSSDQAYWFDFDFININRLRIIPGNNGTDIYSTYRGNHLAIDNITTIPEPATLILVCLGGLALLRKNSYFSFKGDKMKKTGVLAILVCLLVTANFALADTIRGINMDFVTIGNAGNAGDTQVMTRDGTTGYGAVGYNYRIGKYEVTNAQWNSFTGAAGAPTGNDGGYSYSSYWTGAQQPANSVSWYEAAQFCNYLTSGDKSKGAYRFSGNNTNPGSFQGIDRVSSISTYGTTYVIPTENEWHKAAYFKPNASGYSLYPNGTSTAPVAGVNSNYNNAIGSPWTITHGTQEQNGTFDMMGNVFEWNEALISGSFRGVRGGSFFSNAYSLASYNRGTNYPYDESGGFGFRVASVPEPASAMLMILGAAWIAAKRKR